MQTNANRKLEFVTLAIVLVLAAHAIPILFVHVLWKQSDDYLQKSLGTFNWTELHFLAISILLVIHDPKQYGLGLGDFRTKWKWLLVLCGIPILLTLLVYPRLTVKPFHGGPIGIWLISPLAQDLMFAGYFYEKSRQVFPGKIGERVPFERCIIVTAMLFAFWHTPGLSYFGGWYIWFQLVYTFLGACLVGIIRQWTNSIVYITLIHMAVNYIAVRY